MWQNIIVRGLIWLLLQVLLHHWKQLKKHVRKSHWEFYCLVLLEAQPLQIFYFLLLLTRFHVSVPLFSDRSQMMSTCGKNKEEAHEPHVSVPLVFSLKLIFFGFSIFLTWKQLLPKFFQSFHLRNQRWCCKCFQNRMTNQRN